MVGNSCVEYATVGCQLCTWTAAVTSCPVGRHMCTMTELQMAGYLVSQNLAQAPIALDSMFVAP